MALPLTVDPNTLVPPDYALPGYAAARQPLIANGMTDEQAVACLVVAWTAANDQDKVTWQAQLDATAAAAAQRAQELAEAEQQRALEVAQEAEQAQKDEARKHRDKYRPIPMRPTPRADLVLAAPYALKRLEKALYLELYYYTNVGLDAANLAVSSLDDDVMTMQRGEDGIASWVPAVAAKAAKSVVDDQDLTWEQIMEAVPRFITAMESARWDPPRVEMLARFWGALQLHPFKRSRDPLDTRTLIVYQAEQRKRWHQAISTTEGAWDLSALNEEIMLETRDRVYRIDRNRKDDARVRARFPFSVA
ncbi:hypothetical protein B0H21DRAFT_851814 [Amylocystis lapponica]|nr:hypothetical protein B0H21DRAFT_851814 [Amylocystis lapponica]